MPVKVILVKKMKKRSNNKTVLIAYKIYRINFEKKKN